MKCLQTSNFKLQTSNRLEFDIWYLVFKAEITYGIV